ncbi:MAG: formylglycine-generating enzyme family protein, partial [Gammaproteobacteria bacterium]|nr:formylglycine-generating enzyme family protein [Gammaproteobacteria bacterium]
MNKHHLFLLNCATSAALIAGGAGTNVTAAAADTCPAPPHAPVRIAGGTFLMGDDRVYAEEGPVRETTVDGFWIDPHEVTNRQYAEFVAATGHVTIAEQPIDPALFGVPVEQIPPELLLPGSAV